MSNSNWPEAIKAWRNALGPDRVLSDPQSIAFRTANIGGLHRRVPAVIHAGSTEEVQRVVRIANDHRTPIHPISTGKNWGLGSALPVRDDTALLDLGGMNRIREINIPHHYAVIEPGVTQRQLYEHLRERDLPLIINVTGSGADTSLIANALERGIGYFGSRAESLSGMEIVLGTGEIIQTGFGRLASSRVTHQYRYGIGPSLDGLFFQSNFGIVTCAGFELIPRPEEQATIMIKLNNDEPFEDFFDRLVDLRRREVMRSVWHLGNRIRSEISLGPLIHDELLKNGHAASPALRSRVQGIMEEEGFGAWNAVGSLFGSAGQLRRLHKEIRKAMRGVANVRLLNNNRVNAISRILHGLRFIPAARRKRLVLEAMKPLYGLSLGIPTDGPLKSVLWPVGEDTTGPVTDLDRRHGGMMYCLPFFPLSGRAAEVIVGEAARVCERYGFAAAITINFIDSKAGEAVISVAFNLRDAEQTAAAHRCVEELTDRYLRMGYPPYRVGVQSMGQVVDERSPYWRIVRDMKRVFDPNHIISPGRYNLV